ncbi:hypothetical protein GW17_00010536 [Ensete ventricosum]|nr:hypothetical protein GW17_00010536 [Ensete ventricosum]
MAGFPGVKAAPFTYASHVLAVASAAMVLVWCIHFRGGLAFASTNKSLIFNVRQLGFLEKLTFLESSGLYKYSSESFLVNFTALVVIFLGASVVISAIAPAHTDAPQGYSSISEN